MKNKIIVSLLLVFIFTMGISFAYIPKIIIEDYKFEDGNPVAGEKNTLNLTLKNTSKDYSIRNLSVVFNSKEKAEKKYITTYESSNTFYIRRINIDDKKELKIPVFIDPEIPSGVHEVPIKFSYEDVNGKKYEVTHLITVAISVPKKLNVSEISTPEKSVEGEDFNLQIRLFNESKSNIENVKVNLVTDAKANEKNVIIGKIAPGDTEYVDFKVSSDKVGEVKGKVSVKFDDEWKKSSEQTKEFSVEITKKVVEVEDKSETNYKPYFIGVAVFIVLYLIYLSIKKRNKRNKNKELELDE